jgi:hypothetical protein
MMAAFDQGVLTALHGEEEGANAQLGHTDVKLSGG